MDAPHGRQSEGPTMIATLYRDDVRDDCIRSRLWVGGKTFHCLERPWLRNQRNISCIPSGSYRVTFLPRSASGRYRNVWHIQDVPGRSGVLIHSGNVVGHSRGCLLIGKRRGYLQGQPAVLNSRTALTELNSILEGETFQLLIIGNQQCLQTSLESSLQEG